MKQRVRGIRDSFRGKNNKEEKIAQPVGSLDAGKVCGADAVGLLAVQLTLIVMQLALTIFPENPKT